MSVTSVCVCLSVTETISDLPATHHSSVCSVDVVAQASDTATKTSAAFSPGLNHWYISHQQLLCYVQSTSQSCCTSISCCCWCCWQWRSHQDDGIVRRLCQSSSYGLAECPYSPASAPVSVHIMACWVNRWVQQMCISLEWYTVIRSQLSCGCAISSYGVVFCLLFHFAASRRTLSVCVAVFLKSSLKYTTQNAYTNAP